MKTLIIDGEAMRSKESLYLHLTRVFSLPAYFGNNLDALWDSLNEKEEPTKIIFLNVNQAQKQLGHYGSKLIELLEKLAKENANYRISFYPLEL